jgi:hypothetical protein
MGVRGTLEGGGSEYRMRFADRLQKHFFNDGALTPDAVKATWMKFANDLDQELAWHGPGFHQSQRRRHRDRHPPQHHPAGQHRPRVYPSASDQPSVT